MNYIALSKKADNLNRFNIFLLAIFIFGSIFALNIIDLNSSNNCNSIEIPSIYANYEKKNIPKEISVMANFENIRCLGKIYNYEIILEQNSEQDGLIYKYIFYSTRFFLVLKYFLLVWISISFIFLKNRENMQLEKLSITVLYLLIYFIRYDYSIDNFLDHVSVLLVIPFLLSKNDSIRNIKRIGFNNNINLLRAGSVLLVVFYHLDFRLFSIGWIGVDIFFVISGFLISNIIISKLNKDTFNFREFYTRRIKRILPALYLLLIISTPLALMMFTPKELYEFISIQISSLLFVSNFFLQNLDSYTSENTELYPLLHTWSLSIEEQFYILFPFFIYVLFKYFIKNFDFTINAIFLIMIIQHLVPISPIVQFYSTRFRVWEFIFGLLLMVKLANKSLNVNLHKFRHLFFFLSGILFLLDDSFINNIFIKIVVFIAISTFFYEDSTNSKLSNSQNFLFNLGTISYSIYLIHQPLFAFIRKYLLTINYELNNYIIFISLISLYFISCFSYKNVEKRFLNYTNKKAVTLVFILFIVNLSTYFYVINNPNFTDLSSSQLSEQFNESRFIQIDGENCFQRSIDNLCEFNQDQNKSILLIGNSLMDPFAFHVYQNREDIPYKITFLVGHDYFANPTKTVAPNNLYEFTNFIEKNEFDFVIYGGFLADEIELDYFVTKLEYIVNNNLNTILIYPIPSPGFNVPNVIIYDDYDTKNDLLYNADEWFGNNQNLINVLDSVKSEKIIRVYPEEFLCMSNSYVNCYATKGTELMYYDSVHLTRIGSLEIANYIIGQIK